MKMESCVSQVMSKQGLPKDRAIAICKAGIMHSAKGNYRAEAKQKEEAESSMGPHLGK